MRKQNVLDTKLIHTSRFDTTTPKKIPYNTIMVPPRTGYGIVINIADILPNIPNMI